MAKATRITHVQAAEVVRIMKELEPVVMQEQLTEGDVYRLIVQRITFPLSRSSVTHLAAEMGYQFYRPTPVAPVATPPDAATQARIEALETRVTTLTAQVDAVTSMLATVEKETRGRLDNMATTIAASQFRQQTLLDSGRKV